MLLQLNSNSQSSSLDSGSCLDVLGQSRLSSSLYSWNFMILVNVLELILTSS